MKRVFYIASLVLGIIIIVGILYSFSLLESKTTKVVQSDLGKWVIKVNNVDVTANAVDFQINSINYDTNANVKSGKLAPGLGGYFDIAIDPTNTEVSVRYDITFDYTLLQETGTSLAISSISELSGKNLIQTGENTYTGVITLSEISNNKIDTIRANINWPNIEQNNEQDYELGKTEDSTLSIPVNVLLTQYTGEQIVEYEGE